MSCLELYEIEQIVIDTVNANQPVIFYFYPDFMMILRLPSHLRVNSENYEYEFITEEYARKKYREDKLDEFYRQGFPVQFFSVQLKNKIIPFPKVFHPNRALLTVLKHFFVSQPSTLLTKKVLEKRIKKEASRPKKEKWKFEEYIQSLLEKYDIDRLIANQDSFAATDYEIQFYGRSFNEIWDLLEDFGIPWDSDRMTVLQTQEGIYSISLYDPRVTGGIYPGYSPLKIILEKFLPPYDLLYMIENKFLEEDEFIEFKSQLPKNLNNLAKKICAFCNSNSGVLFIGIKDDGEIVGCNIEEAMSRISGICSTRLQPLVQPTFYILRRAQGKRVLMIVIPSTKRPIRSNNIAYTMLGRTVKPLDYQEEKEMEESKKQKGFRFQSYPVLDYLIEKHNRYVTNGR